MDAHEVGDAKVAADGAPAEHGQARSAVGQADGVAVLAAEATRTRLVVVGAAAYTGLLAILTGQALRGPSIVHPDLATTIATAGLFAATVTAVAVVPRTRPRHPAGPAPIGPTATDAA